MDPEPPSSASALLRPKRGRWSAPRMSVAALGVLLLALILFLVLRSLADRKVVWLTSAELARSTQPGPFTGFKQKLRNLASPVLRRFRRKPPLIQIDSILLTLSRTAADELQLGAPVTTNASGMCAWVLTSSQTEALQRQLKTVPGASISSKPAAITFDGGQVSLQSVELPTIRGKKTPVGLTVELFPKLVSRSIKLTIAVTSTEVITLAPDNIPTVGTNFAAACRVSLPNGGSLVLEGGAPKDREGNRTWMILSPTAIDAQGKPIKR